MSRKKCMLTAYQCERIRITPKFAGNDWDVYCIGPKYAVFNENFHFLKNSLQITTQNIFICDPKFCDCADTDSEDEFWKKYILVLICDTTWKELLGIAVLQPLQTLETQ